jgi:hypothetical protein
MARREREGRGRVRVVCMQARQAVAGAASAVRLAIVGANI